MRWVFASLLAGLVTVVLFFGMMRFVEDSEEEAYETLYKPAPYSSMSWGDMAFQPPIVLQNKSEKRVVTCFVHHSPCDGHPTPYVEYPRTGETVLSLNGDCDVSYTVGVDGRPFDIEMLCTVPRFEGVSRDAISKMQYVTEDRCGPCKRDDKRITYTIMFSHE